MAKRRSNKEGTIFKRQDGRWVAAVTLPSGKRWMKYSRTQTEARAKLRDMLRQIDDGVSVQGGKALLADYLSYWLGIVRINLRPRSVERYRQVIEHHITPEIGHIRLDGLRSDHIQDLYASRLEGGVGVPTVRGVHSVLHRALAQAVRWRLITRNVASGVEKPKQPRPEMRILDFHQVQQFLAAADDHRLYALFHLAVTTGLRRGELLGLKWTDLDSETGRLQIQRQLQRVQYQGLVLSEPKSATGRRSISLARVDLAKLQAHRTRQLEERLFAGGKWQEHGLIFTSIFGTPCDPNNVSRSFRKLLKAANLPRIRFHDLRHTAATIMLQQGIHPKIVQERLGHSNINLTLDTYSHVLPDMQKEAAAKIDLLFGAG